MISVIIPVYNVEQYLEKCVRSILDNTYKDLEVICVNDGSPDACLEILQCLAKEDTRVKIINQDNQGVQTARNNGIKEAYGEYIAFVDSDDWVHPQYFESLLTCMEQTGADMAVCGCQKFDDREELVVSSIPDIQYHKLTGEQFFKNYYARHMCWGRLYRKLDIENVSFVPQVRLGDDTLYNLTVVSMLKKPVVYATDTPLYFYLQRSNSIVRLANHQKLLDIADWTVNYYKYDQQHEWSWMLLMQATKMALSSRYGAILHEDHEMVSRAEKVLNILLQKIMQNRQITRKDKLAHWIMKLSPRIYRYFRIKDDPTMKIWETTVREQKG